MGREFATAVDVSAWPLLDIGLSQHYTNINLFYGVVLKEAGVRISS